MAPLAILCFHRVVDDDDPRAWPYLERGTAIRRSTFASLLHSLNERGAFVDPRTPWSRRADEPSTRPRFWITFDDGYRDTLVNALPALRRFGARASVFVTTEVALGRAALPADQWYSVLLSARRRHGTARVGDWRIDTKLDSADGRRRLVMGAERRAFLEADATTRDAMLAALEAALGGDRTHGAGLYLNRADLDALRREGWSVGAHGATHAILPTLSDRALSIEFDQMTRGLEELGDVALDQLAWPDGQHSEATRALARAQGFHHGLALGDELVTDESDPMALPRFIVTDDPHWADSRWPHAARQGGTQ
jgi:peptidoglycan/xylan/chitin deacetylase (PgdA/CDA1 family)